MGSYLQGLPFSVIRKTHDSNASSHWTESLKVERRNLREAREMATPDTPSLSRQADIATPACKPLGMHATRINDAEWWKYNHCVAFNSMPPRYDIQSAITKELVLMPSWDCINWLVWALTNEIARQSFYNCNSAARYSLLLLHSRSPLRTSGSAGPSVFEQFKWAKLSELQL